MQLMKLFDLYEDTTHRNNLKNSNGPLQVCNLSIFLAQAGLLAGHKVFRYALEFKHGERKSFHNYPYEGQTRELTAKC